MKTLAIDGGTPAIRKPLRKWNRYSYEREYLSVHAFMDKLIHGEGELSGYLAGIHKPGHAVAALEEAWAEKFGVKYAIACCSATAGLLAASEAIGCDSVPHFGVSALTMSASEYAPQFRGFYTRRMDVDDWLCAVPSLPHPPRAIVTHLLGHPVQMDLWKKARIPVIEDAAQAVLATENGRYAGTIGNIGVWSFNVHKQLNAGEGGIVGTNNDDYAMAVRDVINHGECRGGINGLNLRMTELTAVIAKCQLDVAEQLIASRRILRRWLMYVIPPPFVPIRDREGCESAAYCLGILLPNKTMRDFAAKALQSEGMPISAGYAKPPVYADLSSTPRAKDLNDRLLVVELCSFDAIGEEIEQIGEAFNKVADALNREYAAMPGSD